MFCTLKGTVIAVSSPVYNIIASSFKCNNGHCLRQDSIIMHFNNRQRISNNGERLFIHDNVAVCLGCRTQMTEMTLARVFQKSIYAKISLDPRFTPVDVVLVGQNGDDNNVQVGDEVVISGYPDPRIMDQRWEYNFTGVATEHVPCDCIEKSRPSAAIIIETINFVSRNGPNVLSIDTSAEIPIVKLLIENSLRTIGYTIITNPNQFLYNFAKRSREVESGRLVYSSTRITNCNRLVCVIYKESKETLWIIEQCRRLRLPLILCGNCDSVTADHTLAVEEDLLIDLLISGSTLQTTILPLKMPASPAPSVK